jgi:hypothetical protein
MGGSRCIPDFSFNGKSCARNVRIRPEKTVFCVLDKRFNKSKNIFQIFNNDNQ